MCLPEWPQEWGRAFAFMFSVPLAYSSLAIAITLVPECPYGWTGLQFHLLCSILTSHIQVLKLQSLGVSVIHAGAHNICLYDDIKKGNYRISKALTDQYLFPCIVTYGIIISVLCHQKYPVASHGVEYSSLLSSKPILCCWLWMRLIV